MQLLHLKPDLQDFDRGKAKSCPKLNIITVLGLDFVECQSSWFYNNANLQSYIIKSYKSAKKEIIGYLHKFKFLGPRGHRGK